MPKLLFSERNQLELTYSDAFLVPYNPIIDRLFDCADQAEIDQLMKLFAASNAARKDSRQFMKDNRGKANVQLQLIALQKRKDFRSYTLELAVKYPGLADQISRDEVDFAPVDGFGNTPIVVANMNNVSGKRMAEVAAMMGGSAAQTQDKDDEVFQGVAEYLHSRDVEYMTPVVVGPNTEVHDLRKYLDKRDIDTALVTEDGSTNGKFIGIVRLQNGDETWSIGMVPKGIEDDAKVSRFMRSDNVVTQFAGISAEDAVRFMEQQRIHFLPILLGDGSVYAVLTKKKASMSWRYKPHVDEENGGLAMLGTVGALNKNPIDRTKFLLDIGAKGIIFDTAHFDQGVETYTNVETAADIIANSARKGVKLIAGNVVTESAVLDIFAAGADIAKVGIGPGAMCSTRMETGVGRPQLSAVLKTARAAREVGKHVWADGGIQHPRDVALALAAGASQVMVGSLFASTYETPTEFLNDGGKLFKENYGMASRHAATRRNLGRLGREMRDVFREVVGHRAEGISGSKVYQRGGLESVADMIHWIMDGVTSSMTYMGARNLDDFSRFARIGVQTASGYNEGTPKTAV